MPSRGGGTCNRAPRAIRSPSITAPCASIQAVSANGATPDSSIEPSTRRPRARTSTMRLLCSDNRAMRALLRSSGAANSQSSRARPGSPTLSDRSSASSMRTPRIRTPGGRIGQSSPASRSRRCRKKAARIVGRSVVENEAISPLAVRRTTSASTSSKIAGSKSGLRSSSGIVPFR